MSEKIKCLHCYSKFEAAKNKKCPKCGMSQSGSSSDSDAFSKLGIALEEESPNSNKKVDKVVMLQESIEELEEDLDRVRNGVKRAANALLATLIGSAVGTFVVLIGVIRGVSENISIGLTISAIAYLLAVIWALMASSS